MKTREIVYVRIYITESSHLLNKVVDYLHDEAKVRGVTVLRGISGFGETGKHSSSLLALSLDLPLVIEFFDDKHKIDPVIDYLSNIIKPEHIVFWPGQANAK